MRSGVVFALLFFGPLLLAGCLQDPGTQATSVWSGTESSTAVFVTSHGTFRAALFNDMTPQTVRNFADLANDGYYDGTRFHRVIEGRFAQGGDPNTRHDDAAKWGDGNAGYHIIDEYPCNDGTVSHEHEGLCDAHDGLALPHDAPGVISMGNMGEPRTVGSQFFVTADRAPWLNGVYSAFGRVTEGMAVVKAIGAVETDPEHRPIEDVVLHSVRVEGPLPDVTVQRFPIEGDAAEPSS